MKFKVVLGLLIGLGPIDAVAGKWENTSWEQRWAASDSILHLALEAQQTGQIDTALVLIRDALQAHPSHYRAYDLKWRILVNIAPRFPRRDSLAVEEIVEIIRADIQTMLSSDHNDDQIYIASFGYDHLYE